MLPGFEPFLIRFSLSVGALFCISILTYLVLYASFSRLVRSLLLTAIWSPLLVLPLVIPYEYRVVRLFFFLICGFLAARSLDLISSSPPFREKPGFGGFFFYVFFALALKYPDPEWRTRPGDIPGGMLQMLRGVGIYLIVLAITTFNTCFHTPETAYWLNVASKVYEWYLLFVCFMDFYYGLARMVGIEGVVNLREPMLSRSPADFWFNRWNLPVIDWIQRYLFIPLGALRHPYRATLITFLISGVIHQYGFNISAETMNLDFLWYFLIHGLAVAGIRAVKRPFRRKLPRLYRLWRDHPLAKVFQHTVTLAFFIVTGSLFFRAVDLVIDFHQLGFVRQLCPVVPFLP